MRLYSCSQSTVTATIRPQQPVNTNDFTTGYFIFINYQSADLVAFHNLWGVLCRFDSGRTNSHCGLLCECDLEC